MDGGKVRRKLAQHAHRGRLIVDEDAALPSGRDLAPQNDGLVFVVGIDAVGLENSGNDLFRPLVNFKNSRDHGPISAGANHIGGSLLAKKKRERINQNGFPRSGLAGQQVQASRELYRQIVDDRVIFKPQFGEHKLSWDARS